VHSLLLRINRLAHSRAMQSLRGLLPDLIIALGFLWLVGLAIINSWVSEDAYITFRVIDNFHQGYGLRWNIHERVQAYTHPLWMMLHIPIYAVWHNLFHVTIAISIACTAAAIMLVLCTVKKNTYLTVLCFFAPLIFSKAFIDYTTSGLENPLAYLLYAWFGFILIKRNDSPHFWFWCSFTVALSLLNRLDTIILYAPTLLWLVWQYWREIRWKQVILGASPLLAWFAFALLLLWLFAA
jgi:arabinofuranosyltransferase